MDERRNEAARRRAAVTRETGAAWGPTEIPPDERAFTLYCQGWGAPHIARALGTDARTVRRWLEAGMRTLASDGLAAEHAQQVLRAIESQRAIATAAWAAHERECEIERALLAGELDHVRRRKVKAHEVKAREVRGEGGGEVGASGALTEEYERPHRTSQAARYLSIALAAQREVARLQGLYAHIEPEPREVHIVVTREDLTPQPPSLGGKGEEMGEGLGERQSQGS
ncbi:MAG: hypothetical protein IVW57_16855 [Ktedonobacterales bacterium]|nr:hypothetical protein [Ktedonobacterales bacterium]